MTGMFWRVAWQAELYTNSLQFGPQFNQQFDVTRPMHKNTRKSKSLDRRSVAEL